MTRSSISPIIVFKKNYTNATIYHQPGVLGHIVNANYQVKYGKIINCKQNGGFINIRMTMEKDIRYRDRTPRGIKNYMTMIYTRELFSSKFTTLF